MDIMFLKNFKLKLVIQILIMIIFSKYIYVYFNDDNHKSESKIKSGFIFGGTEFIGFSSFLYLKSLGIQNISLINNKNETNIKLKREEILKEMLSAHIIGLDKCEHEFNLYFSQNINIDFIIIDSFFNLTIKKNEICFNFFFKILKNMQQDATKSIK